MTTTTNPAPRDNPGSEGVTPATLDAVLAAYARTGVRSVRARDRSAWLVSERFGLSRYPILPAPAPAPEIARELFRARGAWVLDYVVAPSETQPRNADLYLFQGGHYSIEQLSKNGRRDARKAIRELDIRWITHAELMAQGLKAFADVRRRVGLSDGTPEMFAQRFGSLRDVPGHHYLGAFKGAELAAFMTIHAVEHTASIAAYSDSAFNASCPNNGLIHAALVHCVNERAITTVSYGLSSVQESSNAATLHDFKLKAGFEAVPVHRVFRVHPWAAPLVNRGTLALLHFGLRVFPANRMLKKASGAVAQLLESTERPAR